MKWINRLFIFFVGIILTLTSGFGVAAFYPEPVSPVYPVSNAYKFVPQSCISTPEDSRSVECQKYFEEDEQKRRLEDEKYQKYQEQLNSFRNKNAQYTRTAIFLGIAIGAVYALIALVSLRMSRLLSNGLLLAAVLTTILTRLLVKLASFGADATGTVINSIAFLEFGVLVVLSVAVILVGLFSLKENTETKSVSRRVRST